MQILGHGRYVESGGWLHVVTFKTDAGAIVTIEDDSDLIFAASDTPDAISKAELAKLWSEWGMGTSCFPKVAMPPADKVVCWTKLEYNLIMEMSGEEFCLLLANES